MIYREKIDSRYLLILALISFLIPQELHSDGLSAKERAIEAVGGMSVLLKQGSLQKGAAAMDRKLWIELLDQWVASLKELGIDKESKEIRSAIIGLMNKQDDKSLKQKVRLLADKESIQGSIRNAMQSTKSSGDKNWVERHSDVFKQRQESIKLGDYQSTPFAWAARLDFLCSLDAVTFDESGNSVPLVNFKDPNSSDSITIAGQNVTGQLGKGQSPTAFSPMISVIRSIDGSFPKAVRWADTPDKGATVLKADGTGLDNLQRGHFAKDVDYTKLKDNIKSQEQLWIVPNVDTTGTIMGSSESIRSSILSAQQSAHDFKKSKRSPKTTIKHEKDRAITLKNYVLPLVDALAKSLE